MPWGRLWRHAILEYSGCDDTAHSQSAGFGEYGQCRTILWDRTNGLGDGTFSATDAARSWNDF